MAVPDPLPTRASELPDFRVWLVDQWKPGHLFWRVATSMRMSTAVDLGLPTREQWAPIEHAFDSGVIPGARLYWVSAEMSELIDKASRTLPSTTLTPELVPCEEGLVFFEKQLVGLAAHDVIGINDINVHALLWGTSHIPPGPHKALGIATYASFEGAQISPAGRTDWEWGADTDVPIDDAIAEDTQRVESMAEDRRWLATFFLLLSQGGVAQETELRPPRQAARRSQRANLSAEVRLVDVHRPKRPSTEGEGNGVEWSHRWVVEGHWRQQAYGPKHSLRRPKFIAPFVKGPQDKPLIVKETVHVLKDA